MQYSGIIPVNRPDITNKDLEAYYEYRVCGASTEKAFSELNESMRKYIGDGYYIMTPSAKVALYILLDTLKPKRVNTSPLLCFSALAPMIESVGQIRYIDIHPTTYNMDPIVFRKHYVAEGEVVILSCLGGQPFDMETVAKSARERGAIVVEDAAQSLGASISGKKIGTIGDHAIFSFSKHFSLVGGGMIYTKDKDLNGKIWDRMRRWQELNSDVIKYRYERDMAEFRLGTKEADERYFKDYVLNASYEELDPKEPYRTGKVLKKPGPIQPATINSQFGRLDEMLRKRRENAEKIKAGIEGLKNINIQDYDGTPAYAKFYVTTHVHTGRAISKMFEHNIDAKHITKSHGYYIQARIDKSRYYNDKSIEECYRYLDFHDRILELPLSSNMTDDEINRIIKGVEEINGL